MTLLTWFLGAVALPLLLAQVTALWPWLAEKLVRRAARRIPEQERPRWEAELLGELASKPNGFFQFLWALWQLPLLRGTGEMGRLLGAPPIFQVVRARVRAALQKLRLRPKAPPAAREERAVSLQATASVAVAAAADLRVVSRSASTGRAASGTTLSWSPPWRPGMSDQEYENWLFEGQQEFEKWLFEGQQEFEWDLARQPWGLWTPSASPKGKASRSTRPRRPGSS